MKQNLTRSLTRVRDAFASFTTGQKLIAVIGIAGLLLAGVMVFRWAATPDYAPLYSNLASEDASAVIDQLDSQGVPYELSNGGNTIMVPRDQVYETRIALSGKGLPGSSEGGYSLLDDQDLSTSQFQEQTDFKRAMEGELARTIEAIDGVDTAVVHLALPPAKVFADEQDPATASVLVDTATGTTLSGEQVQAVVNLVSSSIDGLAPEKVTVADSRGRVLSSADGVSGAGANTRDQQVNDFQEQMGGRIQTMLDRVLGAGNSTVQVTADLDFDKSVKESTTYKTDTTRPPLSSASSSEQYAGPAGAGGSTGVVGPDGQMDSTTTTGGGGNSSYTKESTTRDNAVDRTFERREKAPGSVNSLHIGVVLDTAATGTVSPDDVRSLIEAAVGIDPNRGDTVEVSSIAFDRTADKAAAAELAAAKAAEKRAQHFELYRNLAIAALVLTLLLVAWWRSRKRNRARTEATTYLVEQLRQESADRAAQTALDTSPALAALERAEESAGADARRELAELVERQPEDVAALLRGWLVER
jgi:flagellar M-ring protein FliF